MKREQGRPGGGRRGSMGIEEQSGRLRAVGTGMCVCVGVCV